MMRSYFPYLFKRSEKYFIEILKFLFSCLLENNERIITLQVIFLKNQKIQIKIYLYFYLQYFINKDFFIFFIKKALDSLINVIKKNELIQRFESCIFDIIPTLIKLIKTSNLEGFFDFIAYLAE